ncbi:MAG TPA: hypothetical protein DCE42_23285 [Myxococcales bacterium]|nr:hypothetical protein [Myxococcales bacterium]
MMIKDSQTTKYERYTHLFVYTLLCMVACLFMGCELWDYECRVNADCFDANKTCHLGSCIDSQNDSISNQPTRLTERFALPSERKVDILFISDRYGINKSSGRALAKGGWTLIQELSKRGIGNLQVGFLHDALKWKETEHTHLWRPLYTNTSTLPLHTKLPTVDPFAAFKQPTSTSLPSSLTSPQLSLDALEMSFLHIFQQQFSLETRPTHFTNRSLEALRDILSTQNNPTGQILLRKRSLVSIIFISRENDCSHNGKLTPPASLSPDDLHTLCHLPARRNLKDQEGTDKLDQDGQPIPGQMQHLHSTQRYIDYLKQLEQDGHQILVNGLLGDPNDIGYEQCYYVSPNKRPCGGCTYQTLKAAPGYRYLDLINTFGEAEHWFSFCQENQYNRAFESFAEEITDSVRFFVLSKQPTGDEPEITVRLADRQENYTTIPRAEFPVNSNNCQKNKHCEDNRICDQQEKRCRGNGWVYLPPNEKHSRPRIALSGNAQQFPKNTAHIEISYKHKTD